MNQDAVFLHSEGNNWYHRNKPALDQAGKRDWPLHLLGQLEQRGEIRSAVELGCSNGYRLEQLRAALPGCRCAGVDASSEAIDDGKRRYPELELHQGLLSELPLSGEFDLAIVNFVLHWVDRGTLARTLSEIDRVIRDGGFLILGDFLPDHQQRRRYHHLPDGMVYTYKQDYARTFESLGTYRELCRFAFDHDGGSLYRTSPVASSARGFCSLLYKSLQGFYPEV